MNIESLLLRAWHLEKKIMFPVVQISYINRYVDGLFPTGPVYEVSLDKIILMRSTGQKDKNGAIAFDQDIVKVPNETYRMTREAGWDGKDDGFNLISWEEKSQAFMRKDLYDLKRGYPLEFINGVYLWVLNALKDSQIIGNFYENPELTNIDQPI